MTLLKRSIYTTLGIIVLTQWFGVEVMQEWPHSLWVFSTSTILHQRLLHQQQAKRCLGWCCCLEIEGPQGSFERDCKTLCLARAEFIAFGWNRRRTERKHRSFLVESGIGNRWHWKEIKQLNQKWWQESWASFYVSCFLLIDKPARITTIPFDPSNRRSWCCTRKPSQPNKCPDFRPSLKSVQWIGLSW